MKTLLTAFALLAATGLIAAAETPAPPCCPPLASAATPACCVEEKPSAPLTARSLYQIEAKWHDDQGRAFALASLRGRPVVLAMFFARCEYACPMLVRDMQRLRDALPAAARDKVQFVLVTFDTQRDTPEALKAYRERMSLDGAWTLLRADPSAVQELAMLLGVKFKEDARGQFAHSNLVTILNREGEIMHQLAGLQGDVSQAAKAAASAVP
jgi:protein SCO1